MRQRKQLDGGLKKFTKCLQNDANGFFEGQQNSLIASEPQVTHESTAIIATTRQLSKDATT
jgi:hypothetical protein